MSNPAFLLCCSVAFTATSLATWFISSRRELFLRVFIPEDAPEEAARGIPQNPVFQSGMRIISGLQLAVSAAFWIAYATTS